MPSESDIDMTITAILIVSSGGGTKVGRKQNEFMIVEIGSRCERTGEYMDERDDGDERDRLLQCIIDGGKRSA